MTYFTQYWSSETCDYYKKIEQDGLLLDHTAGSQFTKRDVKRNDYIYIVTAPEGELFLIGKMQVDYMLFSNKDVETLVGYRVWEAPEHLMAKACTPMRFNVKVPLDITKSLRFVSSTSQALKFVSNTRLNRQTLRTLRILTPQSALKLDSLLEPLQKVSFTLK